MKFIILILFYPFSIFAQEVFFTAKVIEKTTKTPIYGAVITVNDNILTSTDDNGIFKIAIKPDSKTKICISDIAYQTTCFNDFKKIPSQIELETEVKQLEEVVVYSKNNIDLKDFLQRLQKNYKKTTESDFSVPFKARLLSLGKEKPSFYMEVDGIGIFTSLLNTKIFETPSWITCQARIIDTHPENYYKTHNYTPLYELNEYQLYIANHPLKKGTNYYDFQLEAPEIINEKPYWVLSYKLKKQIRNETRYIKLSEGKIWIDPETNYISKEHFSIAFENLYLITGNIVYSQIQGYNIINKISFSYKKVETKKDYKYVLLDFYLPQNRDVYKHLVTTPLINCSEKKIEYEENYWKNYPINNDSWLYKELLLMKNDETFEEAFKTYKNSSFFPQITTYNKLQKAEIKRKK